MGGWAQQTAAEPHGTLNGRGVKVDNRGPAIHTAAARGRIKCALLGSNHRPDVYKTGALTEELRALLKSYGGEYRPCSVSPWGFSVGPLCPYAHSPAHRPYSRSAIQYQTWRNRRDVRYWEMGWCGGGTGRDKAAARKKRRIRGRKRLF